MENQYYYCNCPKENQFYCDANSRIHRRNEKKHILIHLEKFDISCKCHNDEFISFCNGCKFLQFSNKKFLFINNC